jgi:hypothetical protein
MVDGLGGDTASFMLVLLFARKHGNNGDRIF